MTRLAIISNQAFSLINFRGPLIAALFIACWNLLSGREHAGNTDEINEEFIEEGKISRDE